MNARILRTAATAAAAVGAAALLALPAAAQITDNTALISLGGGAMTAVAPGQIVRVPVYFHTGFTPDASTEVASFTGVLSWSSCLQYISLEQGEFGTLEFGFLRNAGAMVEWELSGRLDTGLKGSNRIATLTLRTGDCWSQGQAAHARVVFRAHTVGNSTGVNITRRFASSRWAGGTAHGRATYCVGIKGVWGDVTDGSVVNITDAQQLARFTVSLSLQSPDRMTLYGDATGDGMTDIIDAQQVARMTVGLPAPARIGTPGPAQCAASMARDTVASMIVHPDTIALTVGRTMDLSAFPVTMSGIEGVYDDRTVTWTALNPEVATVTTGGVTRGIAQGTARVVASINSRGRIAADTVTVIVQGSGSQRALRFALTVTGTGVGTGVVRSEPEAVNCDISAGVASGTCAPLFDVTTVVTLLPEPTGNGRFLGWSGACTGTGTCTVPIDMAQSVTASFGAYGTGAKALNVKADGNGNGTISGGGIACTAETGSALGTCSAGPATGATVTLTAQAASGSFFAGWSGACSGTGDCVLAMTVPRTVTALFTKNPSSNPTLAIGFGRTANYGALEAAGQMVVSRGAEDPSRAITLNMYQGSFAQSMNYPTETNRLVTVEAKDVTGGRFYEWRGACIGTSPVCQVSMTQNRSLTAVFRPTWQLTLGAVGSATVRTAATPAPQVSCVVTNSVGTCAQEYLAPDTATVSVTPAAGWVFQRWVTSSSVALECGTSPTCVVPGNRPSASVSAKLYLPVQATQVVAGASHTCALQPNGTVWCWGSNGYGQLGNPSASYSSIVPVLVQSAKAFRSIAAGGNSTCGIATDSTAYCWGANEYAQLGVGTDGTPRTTPTLVLGNLKWRSISVGFKHGCGITTSGPRCWGHNDYYQLAANATQYATIGTPLAVSGPNASTFTNIAVGPNHSCAIGGPTGYSNVYCWGRNDYYQVGNGAPNTSPVANPHLAFQASSSVGAVQLALGGGQSQWDYGASCVRTADLKLYCWGANTEYMLGVGNISGWVSSWQIVQSTAEMNTSIGFIDISMGGRTTCAIRSDNQTFCWGANSSGELGIGSSGGPASTGRLVSGGSGGLRLAAGGSHACFVNGTGLSCWGIGSSGQLGAGSYVGAMAPQPAETPAALVP